MDDVLFAPLRTLRWVQREKLRANDYNPNVVSEENLRLLTQSILSNGWTLPIVVRPDYTIIDYVADVRAATPTAAGEMVIASYDDQQKEIDNLALNLDIAINQFVDSRRKALDVYKNHKALHSPAFYAREQLAVVSELKTKLDALSDRFVKKTSSEINEVKVRLDALNPNNVLTRGYSYVCDKSGRAIESAKSVRKGDNVSIVLSDGSLLSEIKDISINTDGGANDA